MIRLKIVREFSTLLYKLLNSIVEHHFVKEISIKVSLFPAFRHVISAVPQQAELIQRHTLPVLRINGYLPEYFIRHKSIKIRKGGSLISVSHEECRNRPRKSAQMITNIAFNRIFLGI